MVLRSSANERRSHCLFSEMNIAVQMIGLVDSKKLTETPVAHLRCQIPAPIGWRDEKINPKVLPMLNSLDEFLIVMRGMKTSELNLAGKEAQR